MQEDAVCELAGNLNTSSVVFPNLSVPFTFFPGPIGDLGIIHGETRYRPVKWSLLLFNRGQ